MKHAHFVFVGLLSCCVSFRPQTSAGHVVLDARNSPTPAFWTPSTADLLQLEKELDALFAKPDHRLENPTKARLSSYYVRYYGSVFEGRKIIAAEGTHTSAENFPDFLKKNSDPDTITLRPFGGGSAYFMAYYDPATKRVLFAAFNAAL